MASSSSTCFTVALLLLFLSSHALARSSGGPFRNSGRPCEEVYVVGEGETLHTISERCSDPFILEQNPHIQDHDDVFPGLVIKITQRHTKFARRFLNRA
ncbi:hypothetical protein QQ045_030897 [Rhodiola kirilowii]